ncbi:hypothetical protein Emed_006274 [Eimeria media]
MLAAAAAPATAATAATAAPAAAAAATAATAATAAAAAAAVATAAPTAATAAAAAAAAGGWRRRFSSLAAVAAAQQYTRLYDEAFLPRRLRKIKVFSAHPPDSLPQYYHEKLSRTNSNPRSILKLYRRYIRVDDEPDYAWLVRCFCQLGNAFGFNSFWSDPLNLGFRV